MIVSLTHDATGSQPAMPITISIIEDERETRETLKALLNRKPALRCLSAYPSAEAALRGIPQDKPDVVLVDINLPGMSGIECVARLKEQLPKLHVLMLTTYEDAEMIFRSLRAGAKGYLLKNARPNELAQAIEQLHAGGAPMSMQIARKVVDFFSALQPPASAAPSPEVQTLTKREHEVLTLLAKGYHYKEISTQLGISFSTVRTHLEHIYDKLHVESRTEAAVKFLKDEQMRGNR